MIISRTPFRISFFGGGTDYPAWYREHGGAVLATTINKYCCLTCRYLPPFFDHRIRVVWSKIENCSTIDEIAHPAVRETLRYLNMTRGVEIHHDGDLPARSGIGSSSSFVVGLLHALYALIGRIPTKHQLATESIHLEQDILKETVGSQDQVMAAYGGLNHIKFHQGGEISVSPLTLSHDRIRRLSSHLMLFYSGIKRTASDIADSFLKNMGEKKRELRLTRELVNESRAILSGEEGLGRFGELLHEAWMIKRDMSQKISNPQIDELYEAARSAGAIGGKLTGAGGGGFMLLFVPPEMQVKVRDTFKNLIHVPFRFEHSGSQIIFFDPEEDFAMAEHARRGQTIQPFRELDDNAGGPPDAGSR